jgi:hypothetical protein
MRDHMSAVPPSLLAHLVQMPEVLALCGSLPPRSCSHGSMPIRLHQCAVACRFLRPLMSSFWCGQVAEARKYFQEGKRDIAVQHLARCGPCICICT